MSPKSMFLSSVYREKRKGFLRTTQIIEMHDFFVMPRKTFINVILFEISLILFLSDPC